MQSCFESETRREESVYLDYLDSRRVEEFGVEISCRIWRRKWILKYRSRHLFHTLYVSARRGYSLTPLFWLSTVEGRCSSIISDRCHELGTKGAHRCSAPRLAQSSPRFRHVRSHLTTVLFVFHWCFKWNFSAITGGFDALSLSNENPLFAEHTALFAFR